MRRYFYLLLLLFSFSVFSQERNEKIVGEWLIKEVIPKISLCTLSAQDYFDEFAASMKNAKLEFTKSGLFKCSHIINQSEFLRFNNSKWFTNEEGLIELQSLNGEPLLFLRFKERDVKKYYLILGGLEFRIERIVD